MKRTLVACAALCLTLAAAHPAVAADGPVRNYYCNGIPLGPCALPESATAGKVLEWCQNTPLGNGSFYKQCINIRVIRNKVPNDDDYWCKNRPSYQRPGWCPPTTQHDIPPPFPAD